MNKLELLAIDLLRFNEKYAQHPITAHFIRDIISDPEFCGYPREPEEIFDKDGLELFYEKGWTRRDFPSDYKVLHNQERWLYLIDRALLYLGFSVVTYRIQNTQDAVYPTIDLHIELIEFNRKILEAHSQQVGYELEIKEEEDEN